MFDSFQDALSLARELLRKKAELVGKGISMNFLAFHGFSKKFCFKQNFGEFFRELSRHLLFYYTQTFER